MISAFLSYSHADKQLAGLIKGSLDYYDFDVFLAHEDLEPSVEWRDVILLKLKECAVFLPLLTKSFKSSDWTDQETGIAVGFKKIVVPLRVTMNPYGFISKYQAQSFAGATDEKTIFPSVIEDASWRVVKTLTNHGKIGGKVKDGVIRAFGRSGSFKEGAKNADRVMSIEPLNDQQLNDIVRLSCGNDQIWHGFDARSRVRELIERESKRIDKSLARQFNELLK